VLRNDRRPIYLTTGTLPMKFLRNGQRGQDLGHEGAPFHTNGASRQAARGGSLLGGTTLTIDKAAVNREQGASPTTTVYHEMFHAYVSLFYGTALREELNEFDTPDDYKSGKVGLFTTFGKMVNDEPDDPANAYSADEVEQDFQTERPVFPNDINTFQTLSEQFNILRLQF